MALEPAIRQVNRFWLLLQFLNNQATKTHVTIIRYNE